MNIHINNGTTTIFMMVDKSEFISFLLRKSVKIPENYNDRFVKNYTFYKNWYDYFISNAHKITSIYINGDSTYIIDDKNHKYFLGNISNDIKEDISSLYDKIKSIV